MRADPIVLDSAEATLGLLAVTLSAATRAERRFVLLNRSREVWPYQTAVLCNDSQVLGHCGVGDIDSQGPYAQWLGRLLKSLQGRSAGAVNAAELDEALARECEEYWPPHLAWLPGTHSNLVLTRDVPWSRPEIDALDRWWKCWEQHDLIATRAGSGGTVARALDTLRGWTRPRRAAGVGAGLLALAMLALWPVGLTVRAPGELVPRQPVVLRAALDGTVKALKVEPNQAVTAGQVLAELDDAGWRSRLQVAEHALATAEAEWRQVNQQVLNDPKARSQLASAQGNFEERRSEVLYLRQQVQRTSIVAPSDGVVLVQDPGSWPGRTVVAGETVMKLAQPRDQEVEAWLAVADAVDLPPGAPMTLHLANRPGQPVAATLSVYAFEAEQRPDHGLGYRLRGTLSDASAERLHGPDRGAARASGVLAASPPPGGVA